MEQFELKTANPRDFQIAGIGSITFTKWLSTKAQIDLTDGAVYQLEPKGSWGVRYQLIKEGNLLYDVKMSFWGKITITPIKEQHHFYTLKHRAIRAITAFKTIRQKSLAPLHPAIPGNPSSQIIPLLHNLVLPKPNRANY